MRTYYLGGIFLVVTDNNFWLIKGTSKINILIK